MIRLTAHMKHVVAILSVLAAGSLLPACQSTGGDEGAELTVATASETQPSNADISSALSANDNNIAAANVDSKPASSGVKDQAANAPSSETDTPAVQPKSETIDTGVEVPASAAAEADPFAGATTPSASVDPVGAAEAELAAPAATPAAIPAAVAQQAAPASSPAVVAAAPQEVPVQTAPEAPVPVSPFVAASEPAPSTPSAPTVVAESATVSPGALPEEGSLLPYVVQKGDTLANIAKKILGSRSSWVELAKINNLKDPSRIYAGDVVLYRLNGASKTFAARNEVSGRRVVTVEPGETLWTIAARELGDPAAWRKLWKNNPSIQDPNVIHAGTKITIVQGVAVAAK
jgi:nucleoid-associated protein YgaU